MGRSKGMDILMCLIDNDRKVMNLDQVARFIGISEDTVRRVSKRDVSLVYIKYWNQELVMRQSEFEPYLQMMITDRE